MVRNLAGTMMGPKGHETLKNLRDPASSHVGRTTLHKAQTVGCPALVVHGERDDIVPASQGKQCYDALGSVEKAFELYPTRGPGPRTKGTFHVTSHLGTSQRSQITCVSRKAPPPCHRPSKRDGHPPRAWGHLERLRIHSSSR